MNKRSFNLPQAFSGLWIPLSSFRKMLATDISGRDLPRMLTNSYCRAENWLQAVIYAFEFRRDKEGIT